MGGISKGGFNLTNEATLLFTGKLSLDNNGGFASVRTKPSYIGCPINTTAIIIMAKGDGRTYWVDLRE